MRASARIQQGEAQVEVIPDRESAIARAVEVARGGDVVVMQAKDTKIIRLSGLIGDISMIARSWRSI